MAQDEMPVLTPKRIGAIISAYTGFLCGDFSEVQAYADEVLQMPTRTHDFGSEVFKQQLKIKSQDDFKKLHRWCGGKV